MRYTLLRRTGRGVVLREIHERRLGLAGTPAADFDRFALEPEPGVFAVWSDGARLWHESRPESALFDGMPVQRVESPFAGRRDRYPKPASPNIYDAIRSPGVATLLTSRDGREILESCRAAVLGWDGERFVFPPDDRPRVWSVAETAIREHLPAREAPLLLSEPLPLLLANALKGPCAIAVPGRSPAPAEALDTIAALFARLTR